MQSVHREPNARIAHRHHCSRGVGQSRTELLVIYALGDPAAQLAQHLEHSGKLGVGPSAERAVDAGEDLARTGRLREDVPWVDVKRLRDAHEGEQRRAADHYRY